MVAYYKALELLLVRDEVLYLPGHGPRLPDPRALVAELLAHRQKREASILDALKTQEWMVTDLAEHLYAKTNFFLKKAAERNLLAHLLKLEHEGKVIQLPEDKRPAVIPAALIPKELLPVFDDLPAARGIETAQRDGLRRFSAVA